jgi:toxin ParE1/3/4
MNTTWWSVRLSSDAAEDFAGIIQWTRENFGVRQARTYAATLENAMDALHAGPSILGAKQRDDLGSSIRTLHVARNGRKGRHFIVFRIGGDQIIDVLRLLHDSMELANHLSS